MNYYAPLTPLTDEQRGTHGRIARYALKANLMFTLLDRRRMALDELPAYLDEVGLYRELNALYFRLPPAKFAEFIVGELEKSGAAKRIDGWLAPAQG